MLRVGLTVVLLLTVALPLAVPAASACTSSNPVLDYVVCGQEKFELLRSIIDQIKASAQLVFDQFQAGCDAVDEASQAAGAPPSVSTVTDSCNDPEAGAESL